MNLFWESLRQLVQEITGTISPSLAELAARAAGAYTLVARWLFPLLAFVILLRCLVPLIRKRTADTVWGYLVLANGTSIPVRKWESLIGRGKYADIVINFPVVSRSHAVLTFRNGNWIIADLGSKGGIAVNGTKVEQAQQIQFGDLISLAGIKMALAPVQNEISVITDETGDGVVTDREGELAVNCTVTLLLLILFQVLAVVQLFASRAETTLAVIPVFGVFFLCEFLHYLLMRKLKGKNIELELLAYYLCGLNLALVASAAPKDLVKQLAAILLGIAAYTVITWLCRDLGRASRLKYLILGGGVLLLVLNLAFGERIYGARNWINLGFITFQPLEFVKIAFVLAGTATLDRLLTTKNMTAFIAFTGACIITLALIRDFGTAVVFFGAFLVIAFMHSGDLRTLFLVTAGAAFAGIAVVTFMPYIATRFAAWGRVWQYADSAGFQQTRTMIAAASGGLFGVGGGNGYLKRIAAADTDLVFGMLCEEWGMLVALGVVLVIVFFVFYAVLLTNNCRSAFYAIAACGAATIFLLQTALNVLGSVDVIPLTGVTIPFISNGGSSMIASWGLLAMIKTAA
ncbi:MAG TPA: FtsW/RodA/SpoVE family cell cycle protein [Firmicutes bacterium]|nr:FtsW/RodA/SpoVE family cell cycle protein [Bacillota bacterium]